MSDDDRARWNTRYNAGAYGERTKACALLERWVSRWHPLTPGARALDLACGAGRNSIYLAQQGYSVDAIDISAAALARGAERAAKEGCEIHWQEQDLDEPCLDNGYSLIIVVRYADLDLVRRLPQLLRPGGRLLVEAHLGGPLFLEHPSGGSEEKAGENEQLLIGGPSSERFRLAPGSLAAACIRPASVPGSAIAFDAEGVSDAESVPEVEMKVLHSDEALISDPDGRLMALAQFVGERLA